MDTTVFQSFEVMIRLAIYDRAVAEFRDSLYYRRGPRHARSLRRKRRR